MNPPADTRGLHIPLWLVAAAALVFVLFGLGSFAILDNNEGLYAEIPREMLAAHDWRAWVIPHLNGLPYMEKPPLLYWLTALSFALFGESEWSARLVPGLASLGCVALLVWFGNAVRHPQAGRLAALMFVSGLGVTAMSHVLMFDMLLTGFLTAAMMCAYRFYDSAEKKFLRWSYGFLALALLAKGLVALALFGLVILGLLLWTRPPRAWFAEVAKWLAPGALLVFFAIAAPWHIAASLTEPIFAHFYFFQEHVLRFLGKREPHDYYAGPWWYYLPRMVIYLFPWSFLLPCLLLKPDAFVVRGEGDRTRSNLTRFLWLSWLAPLVFFSLSGAKANYYLVAVMPFAALHLAIALENRLYLGDLGRALPGILIGLLAAGLGVALVLRAPVAGNLMVWGLNLTQFAMLAAGGVTVLALGAGVLAWRNARVGILAYVAIPLWTLVLLMATLSAMEPTISTRPIATYLRGSLASHKVYLYREFEQQSSLPYYLKRVLPVVDLRSADLYWGDRLRPGNAIAVSADDFSARLGRESVAVVVTDRQIRDFRASAFIGAFKGEKRIGNSTVFFN